MGMIRLILWGALGAVALVLIVGGAWILSLPGPSAASLPPPPVAADEAAATLAALKPPKRARPLIAVVGINDSTETTDYLMPTGILRRAGVADVVTLGTRPGPMTLFPTLKVEPDATLDAFDAQHADGADYVIVPAMSRDDDPDVMAFLRSQAGKGALIVGICAGAKVVAAAGLLDGKRATTHWYYLKELRQKHPAVTYVADRRIVTDRGVATTTGITASMPMALTLIEAIAGADKARVVARDLGLPQWDTRHRSADFSFTRPFALTAIANTVAFWEHERLGLALTPGLDEVALALVADAWSRTWRSRAVTFANSTEAQVSRNGVRIVPDEVVPQWPAEERIAAFDAAPPARALDQALRAIAARHGPRTADFVAMQLEYPTAHVRGLVQR